MNNTAAATAARWFSFSSLIFAGVFLLAYMGAGPGDYFPPYAEIPLAVCFIAWLIILLIITGLLTTTRDGRQLSPRHWLGVGGVAILVLSVSIAWILIINRNTEPILGNDDQGTYTLSAINLAKSNHYHIQSEVLTQCPDSMFINITSKNRSEAIRSDNKYQPKTIDIFALGFMADPIKHHIIPIFPPAYPLTLAVGYRWSGMDGMSLIHRALIPLAALLSGLLILRTLGKWPGVLTWLTMLSLPLHLWIGNTFYAEPLVMVWGLLALLLMTWRLDHERLTTFAVVTAVSAGAFCKIDGFLLAITVYILLVTLPSPPALRRVNILSAISSAGLVAWYWFACSPVYLQGSLNPIIVPSVITAMIGILAVGTYMTAKKAITIPSYIIYRSTRYFGVACLGLAMIYAGLIRSHVGIADTFYYWPMDNVIPSHREETVQRLAWYFSIPGLCVACLGLMLLWSCSKWQLLAPLLLVGTMALVVFSYDLFNNPLQPYAMRRFLPYGIPLLAISIACWWVPLSDYPRAFGSAARLAGVATVIALMPWWWTRGFALIQQGHASGITQQLEAISSGIPANSVVLIERKGPFPDLAMPLLILFNKEVVLYRSPNSLNERNEWRSLLSSWQSQGRSLIYLTHIESTCSLMPDLPQKPLQHGALHYSFMPYDANNLRLKPSSRQRSYFLSSYSIPANAGTTPPSTDAQYP